MNRRDFIGRAALASGAVSLMGGSAFAQANKNPLQAVGKPFKMDYAPHFGMFKNHVGDDPIEELKFMFDQGFRSLEDNGMLGRPVEMQNKIAATLERLGMRMGVFVIDGGDNWKISLTTGKKEFKDKFVDTCKRSVELAKRANAKWMTVVPGFYDASLPIGIQTANVIDALRAGAEILEPHGLIMVLEPLSDRPDLFMRTSAQTYELCKAVDSPSCKILYDIYHMQRNEGNLIANINLTWDEIAYFQIGDNPGRKEPTTGEINYKNVFKHIYDKGYRGVMGMEHGISKPGKEGEMALVAAYREVDNF
ncbi:MULTISPECIES: hydroxypyruvate isomerase family protein [unclassified Imperialibacter]|uniref:hydroxypyruvate isomerase family protein n=1 Tax=unclassified Imperialibacter TaxID=2629706 RepID=UPI0012562D9E|nr:MULTISPECIES: TIM barrel protein [unclassified Imperialibacter]CAD5290800.1 Hydroxypyruvate isomerase [Imperialibacter sp. 89]CAD5291060.1 Hydroxypyruvate isomerase [Imperialibacter sp. 75]VVT34426.1 Hydroxypyruvate isomerase [Imperialibacter sp. EC-SDR9]